MNKNNNNNNNMNFINYDQAIASRKCWYIYCECKRGLPAIGNARKNGKEGKKEYTNRRFHTNCSSEYNSRVENATMGLSLSNPNWNELTEKAAVDYLKPEFRPFLDEFYKRKSYAIKKANERK
tara:strand:- start:18 stop:386 length:369 start_codon:yes stop_codon:yes gene_type:complete